MSRGFVKEDDQEEIPLVPPRADLPEGLTNYVTPTGMDELLAEKQGLIDEKDSLDRSNENERRIAVNYIIAKLQLLENRIATAKVIKLEEQPQNEVRFGARINLKAEAGGQTQTLQIVGVDEANFSRGKISFTSPLARVLINKKVGDRAVLKREGKDLVFEVLDIAYPV